MNEDKWLSTLIIIALATISYVFLGIVVLIIIYKILGIVTLCISIVALVIILLNYMTKD